MAAYDTVWPQGLALTLLHTVPDHHMVQFIINIILNCSFVLKTSEGQNSQMCRLRNGVPQGSTLSPILFNIYISDIPHVRELQYGYADDLALLHSDQEWCKVERTLSVDTQKIMDYLSAWRLKLSMAKTITTAFHLINQEAKRQFAIFPNGSRLQHSSTPKYLGVNSIVS